MINHIGELSRPHFFALRTPLLPIEELIQWSDSLSAARTCESTNDFVERERAWAIDIKLLRDRLRKIVDRPDVMLALSIASPTLLTGIEHWRRDPESKKGLQAERALVRYFARMCSRPTPFGLFSGLTVGRAGGNRSALLLSQRSQNRFSCRLDFEYLFALTSSLQRDENLQLELRYWPNSSLRKVGDSWHYTESRLAESGRSHHLVKIAGDEYLEAVLRQAENGATIEEMVEAVRSQPGSIDPSEEEARDFVLDLIRDNDLLVSSLSPLLTGSAPIDDIIQQLGALPSGVEPVQILRDAREQIRDLEQRGLGARFDDFRAITLQLEKLPAKFNPSRLYQIDMMKRAEDVVLSTVVVDQIVRGIEILCRVGESGEPDELKAFREAFIARYDRAMIPLMEALDEDTGIGLGQVGRGTDSSPLLRGLRIEGNEQRPPQTRRTQGLLDFHTTLLRKILASSRDQSIEIELDRSDLPEGDSSPRLAEAFCVLCTLDAQSATAMDRGDFNIYLHGGAGPSGARLLGRFCHVDSEIDVHVREHLREEEKVHPDAIYAEVVYLPEERTGNVSCRPVLRDYEIPYLGRSGATRDRQIPVSDLLIAVEGEIIVLYSRRLARRILPRLTNAHSFMNPQLSWVYRFLCYLQHQNGTTVPAFSWGPLEVLDTLPRVRVGNIILSLARWRLSKEEIGDVLKSERGERFIAAQELRRKKNLPRWVSLREGDNALAIDLENALSVDAFAHVLKRVPSATLIEMFPSPERVCVESAEGHFYHEIDIPFVRKTQDESDRNDKKRSSLRSEAEVTRDVRSLPPGSEWLYLKLYGGGASLDELLSMTLLPLVQSLSSPAFQWFFIRYSDPHEHIRVRFKGTPTQLIQEVLPKTSEAFNPLVSSGKLWKIELDTYDRELERYGGIQGMEISERIFWMDSEAVLEILQHLHGDAGLDMRWRIGLVGMDRYLSDWGLGDEEKRSFARQSRDKLQKEFRLDNLGRKALSDKFRAERSKLESLLGSPMEEENYSFADKVLNHRSERIRPEVQALKSINLQGSQTMDFGELAWSFSHMFINRLIRSAQRTHELVLYDFLFQLYDSKISRNLRTQRHELSHEVPKQL